MENKPKDYTIAKKAYTVDLKRLDMSHVEYPWDMESGLIVRGDTINEAKKKLLANLSKEYDIVKTLSGDKLTYLNVPIIRHKESDLLHYKGEVLTTYYIGQKKRYEAHEEELNQILANPEITHCYIHRNGSYYSDNHNGYTDFRDFAGVYTKEEAVRTCRNILENKCIPIDIKEHNESINKRIEHLQSHLL
jgi:hypothetical protein